jgi:hypothetical protein
MLPTRACCACTGRPDNFAAMSPTSENGRLYTCAIATTCVRVRPLESCMADSSSDERGKDRRTPTAYIYHITCQGFHRPGRHETARGLKTGRCAQCEPATYYEYTYCSMPCSSHAYGGGPGVHVRMCRTCRPPETCMRVAAAAMQCMQLAAHAWPGRDPALPSRPVSLSPP